MKRTLFLSSALCIGLSATASAVDVSAPTGTTTSYSVGNTNIMTDGPTANYYNATGTAAQNKLTAGSATAVNYTIIGNGRLGLDKTLNTTNLGTLIIATGSTDNGTNITGGQLFLNGWSDDGLLNTLTNNVIIGTSGYYEADNGGAIRMHEGATIQGTVTLVANAEIRVTGNSSNSTISGAVSGADKTLTIAGNSARNLVFTNAVNVGSLNISTGATFSTDEALNSVLSASSIDITAGTTTIGRNNANLTDSSSATTFTVGNATLALSITEGTQKEFTGALVLGNGATLNMTDGNVKFSGNATLGEAGSDRVTLIGNWGKSGGLELAGAVSGSAQVYLRNGGNLDTSSTEQLFNISGSSNTFSGTYHVGVDSNGRIQGHLSVLQAGSETALSGTGVDLAGGNVAKLQLTTTAASIRSLAGATGSVVAATVNDATLTITGTDNASFSGEIRSGLGLTIAAGAEQTLLGATLGGAVNVGSSGSTYGHLHVSETTTMSDYMGVAAGAQVTIAANGALNLTNTSTNKGIWIQNGATITLENGAAVSAFGVTVRNANKTGTATMASNGTGEAQFGVHNTASASYLIISDAAVSVNRDFKGAEYNNDKNDIFRFQLSGGSLTIEAEKEVHSYHSFDSTDIIVESGAKLALNATTEAERTLRSVTLHGGTITFTDNTAPLTTTALTVSGSSAIETGLVMTTGTLTFDGGESALTLGGDLNLGDEVRVVVSADALSSLSGQELMSLIAESSASLTIGSANKLAVYALSDGVEQATDYYIYAQDGKVYMTPEPTTATLSLLALAGLCARRRRR